MATLWYEWHCGMAHFRLGDLRQSLKQLSYLEKHINLMYEDCLDFFYCSMRRTTLNHYLQMWDYQNKLYEGKWPTKSAITILKVIKRIRRDVASDKGKITAVKAEHAAYLKSDEHTKWLKEWDEKDEDLNELRNDPDPKGWDMYLQVLEDPTGYYLRFAEKTATANPGSAELQVKGLDLFIAADKTESAL